jgi:hypothetical protein
MTPPTHVPTMLITPIQAALYRGVTLVPENVMSTTTVIDDVSSNVAFLQGSPVFTGIVCYVTGLVLLTTWENFVVPSLQLESILPDVPLLPGQLTQKEKSVGWITPLTANSHIPPPLIEDLRSRGKHLVGRRGDVRQFITLEARHTHKGVCEESQEWSDHYGVSVTIYKEREE